MLLQEFLDVGYVPDNPDQIIPSSFLGSLLPLTSSSSELSNPPSSPSMSSNLTLVDPDSEEEVDFILSHNLAPASTPQGPTTRAWTWQAIAAMTNTQATTPAASASVPMQQVPQTTQPNLWHSSWHHQSNHQYHQ